MEKQTSKNKMCKKNNSNKNNCRVNEDAAGLQNKIMQKDHAPEEENKRQQRCSRPRQQEKRDE